MKNVATAFRCRMCKISTLKNKKLNLQYLKSEKL